MIEQGIVIERLSDGRVLVEVDRRSACDGCHSRGSCSLGFGLKKARVAALDEEGMAGVGDRVTMELADRDFLVACSWVYLVPLAGLLTSALLAWWLLGLAGLTEIRDLGSALAALAGTGASLAVVWLRDRKVRDTKGRFEVRIRARAG